MAATSFVPSDGGIRKNSGQEALKWNCSSRSITIASLVK